jgi:hypothetical protein
MTGNCHVRFLGGLGIERSPVYPVWQRLEAEAYLMRLKDGRSVRLLNITKLTA